MPDVVKAIHLTGTNADLIVSAMRLGYLRKDDETLDATYGHGTFWKKWQPTFLVANDIDIEKGLISFDFREFPVEWEARFDVVVFDPDYKLQGTSSNDGPASSNARYGMDRDYRPVDDTWQLYQDGMRECVRVLKPGGMFLVKTMDQVVSGNIKWLTFDIVNFCRRGTTLGGLCLEFVDLFMLEGMRAQPSNRTRKCAECKGQGRIRKPSEVSSGMHVNTFSNIDCPSCAGTGRVDTVQQHASRNYSTLLIFRKRKR